MRAVVSLAAALSAAALATTTSVDAVKVCSECPTDKLCIKEDLGYAVAALATSININFCNFDAAASASYELKFALAKPLACDQPGALLPVATTFTPGAACSKEDCVVAVTLKDPIDWAIALMNGDDVNVLQAKVESPAGQTEQVQVAKLGTQTSTLVINGLDNAAATICTTKFGVEARQLSKRAECNVVELCSGKADDTVCTTPIAKGLTIDDVACEPSKCTGTLTTTTAIPCSAVGPETGAIVISVTVGNSAVSTFKQIATLTAPPAPTISDVTKTQIGSNKFYVLSDATCLPEALTVTVSDATVDSLGGTSEEVAVTLESALTSDAKEINVSIGQCGAMSPAFLAKVGEASADVETDSPTSSNDGSSPNTSGDVGEAGKTSTQTSNQVTGLPYGLYIGIAIGVLAFGGFLFECWYHKRKQRQGTHTRGPVTNGAGHSVA